MGWVILGEGLLKKGVNRWKRVFYTGLSGINSQLLFQFEIFCQMKTDTFDNGPGSLDRIDRAAVTANGENFHLGKSLGGDQFRL